MNELIKNCPKCSEYLVISEYSCPDCNTKIKGEFKISESNDENHHIFNKLTEEDRYFVLVFLQTGGVIQNVERVMGISYPTVKAKLKEIQDKLSGEIHDRHQDHSFNKHEFKREMRQFKHNLKRHIRARVHQHMKDGLEIKLDLDMNPHQEHNSFSSKTSGGDSKSSHEHTETSENTQSKISDLLDKLDSGESDVDDTMNKIKNLKFE